MAKLNRAESNFKIQMWKAQKDIRKEHGEEFNIYMKDTELVRAEYD